MGNARRRQASGKFSNLRPTKEQAKRAMKDVEKITGQSRSQIVEATKDKTRKWVNNLKQQQRGIHTSVAQTPTMADTMQGRQAQIHSVHTATATKQLPRVDAKVRQAVVKDMSKERATALRKAYLGRLG